MSSLNQFRKELDSDDGQKVQLNKGHYSLDSEERTKEFSEILSSGWEDEYKTYRDEWEKNPASRTIRDYPLLVDIELASICNLKCPMCYTTTKHFKETVNLKLMQWELFKKIADEISGKVPAARLSWRGESTLHPKFIDAVKYLKEKGIGEVSFLTNGTNMHLDYFKKLVDAGVDWITISFDGIGEEYNKIRAPLIYEETLKKLEDAMNYKRSKGLKRPTIKVQGIWPAIRKDPENFYKTMKNVSDLVAFNPLIDYLSEDSLEDIVYEKNFCCPQLYQRLFVSSTGEVMMCSSDEYGKEIVGDANFESIHQIWHGKKLNLVRSIHAKEDGFKEIQLCKACFFPRKTEVSETAIVDNRSVHVENYVNRKQEVGISALKKNKK